MHRINVARAVPLSLTQLHAIEVSRFRADPLVADHFSLDVLFHSMALDNTMGPASWINVWPMAEQYCWQHRVLQEGR